jgi:steroid 5-alpha reductase family enzyme
MDDVVATLALSAGAVLALLIATWLMSLALRDVSIVDIAWGLGFVVIAWVAFFSGNGNAGRRTLLAILVTVWGLRLASYIGARKLRHPGEDPRYGAWRKKWGDRFWIVSLVNVFLLQAALVWIVSLPVQGASAQDASLGWLDWVGVALWAVGLFFEGVGDAQMARFKADSANRGKVMDRGLWRLTRHPNYFGDFCVWWGIGLIALSSGAWWSLIGPAVVTLLLTRVSGKDHLERSLSQRPGYAEYIERTSGFFPRPPRG